MFSTKIITTVSQSLVFEPLFWVLYAPQFCLSLITSILCFQLFAPFTDTPPPGVPRLSLTFCQLIWYPRLIVIDFVPLRVVPKGSPLCSHRLLCSCALSLFRFFVVLYCGVWSSKHYPWHSLCLFMDFAVMLPFSFNQKHVFLLIPACLRLCIWGPHWSLNLTKPDY